MNRKINLLMLEDSDDDAVLMLNQLGRSGMEVVSHLRVDTADDFAKALRDPKWDIILSDYHLPTLNGLDAVKIFNESKVKIPLIVVSGTITDVEAVAILKEGANDFVSKTTLGRLPSVVARELHDFDLKSSLRKAEEERNRSYNEVKRANDFISEMLATLSGVAVFAKPTQGEKLTMMSGSIVSLTGFSVQEFLDIDDKLMLGVHPEDKKQALSRDNVASDGAIVNEFRFQHKQGHWVDLLVRKRDVQLSGDKELTTIGIIFDQSERIRAEQERNTAREQMYHNNKLASLGEMSGAIAHEINNPLAIISGKSAQLKVLIQDANQDKEKLLQFVTVIEETALRIVKIVNGLRTISRQSEKDLFKSVSVDSIIEGTLAFCNARFRYLDIRLIIGTYSKSLAIECRPAEISQVLVNLLSNACDAIEKLKDRWVQIDVSDDIERVHIDVIDSGTGVPKEVQEHFAEKFFTTKGPGKGTGLGLTISKRIAENHHGEFKLTSKGPNTCFRLSLPKIQKNPK